MILREILATLLLQQGTHPKIVSERLGHVNISMTLDIYSHVLPNMQLEAVRKLENIFT
ncbi:tyrosine-type recombinase/integrase [Clostridium intestinale]|nr:tyrosine-type recombinase/integrase [Clostridium intestinale]